MRSRHMTDTNDELDSQGENGYGTEHLRRKEQDFLDRIIHGSETGHYFMILGCKVCLYIRCLHLAYPYPPTHRAGDWKDDHDLRRDASQSGGRCLYV